MAFVPHFSALASWLGSCASLQAFADATGMPLLPGNLGTILWSVFLFYAAYAHLAELGSRLVLGRKRWNNFSPATKKEWRMRTVNLLKGLAIGVTATYFLIAGVGGRQDRVGLVDRMFRRDVAIEKLGAISVGFYIWHLGILLQNFADEGVGNVAHHIVVSTCTMSIYRPFIAHHLPCFLSYEVTNIPHNFYRMSKILGSGHIATWFSAAWIVSFFIFRIVYGTYASLNISQDFIALWGQQSTMMLDEPAAYTAAHLAMAGDQTLVIRPVPKFVIVWCLACTALLASLNFSWFYKIARSTGMRLLNGGLNQRHSDSSSPNRETEKTR